MTTSTKRSRRAAGMGLAVLLLAGCSDASDKDAKTGGAGAGSGMVSGSAGQNGSSASGAGQNGSSAGDAGKSGSSASNAGSGSASNAGSGSASNAGAGGSASNAGAGGTASNAGSGGSNASNAGSSAAAGSAAMLSYDEAKQLIDDYMTAHPGQDGDVNAKTPAQIAADPDAQKLLGLCGEGQRPVIPALAWEYGGSDHAWMNYEQSALVYCTYIPVTPNSDHWQYDAAADHVTVDVYVLYPEQNPCKDETGADQVLKCAGDPSNFEIIVDLASLNDGADAGLSLSEASTELKLVLPDGSKVHLWDDA